MNKLPEGKVQVHYQLGDGFESMVLPGLLNNTVLFIAPKPMHRLYMNTGAVLSTVHGLHSVQVDEFSHVVIHHASIPRTPKAKSMGALRKLFDLDNVIVLGGAIMPMMNHMVYSPFISRQ